jgi:hypothetical protein
MDYLHVALNPPTEQGQLNYEKDPEIEPHILYIKGKNYELAGMVINIRGGLVLLRLTQNRVLNSAEFLIHQKTWQKDPNFIFPTPRISADLVFPNIHKHHYDDDLPVVVTTDERYSYARIMIGDLPEEPEWVRLSDNCMACIETSILKGFLVKRK